MKKFFGLVLPILLLFPVLMPFNTHTIMGKVMDERGNPLSSVNIIYKGSRITTTSSIDGSYQIKVPGKDGILVFSLVGMKTEEVKIMGRSSIPVTLKTAEIKLEEVVVTAHGIKRKSELVGAVTGAPGSGYMGVISGMKVEKDQFYEYGYGENVIHNTEDYDHITENRFLKVKDNPLSTFSIDVDAASYSNIRRHLNQGQMPPAGAVRIEEMINYFHYDYPQPKDEHPFSIQTEISDAPWNKDHKLVMIGLQGKKIPTRNLPASNLVFLIDVSGSMQSPVKLPLVKSSMKLLVDQLREEDKVAIVVYAGAAGLVLSPTNGSSKAIIREAIDKLEAGGSTAGGAGIRLAYKTAREFFVKGGNNRVILCTDGDFNVGASSDDDMERLIEQERKTGVFLTVLGYGMGNYKDNKMQKLADKGNGNHAYIDGISEAKKVLVNEFGGTLFTIAKDVKLQVEFNPTRVQGYRLIGYENRMLAKEDFNDDKKDAGELGSGHTVTALYEIIPVGIKSDFLQKVDSLKYQTNILPLSQSSHSNEIMTVKFRYKKPDGDKSQLMEHPVRDSQSPLNKMSENFRFAAAVAEFGMLLRNSSFRSYASYDHVIKMALKAKGRDVEG
ncbi:MAG TPA: von Willebrand factor type A domain-containing protein, partial [Chitinophagaceae bacterium]|nr:von Willebrand factor type A domain-containing protein [Chitinophagaceae bacterium]